MRPYVVWIPMLDADEGSEVPHASTTVAVTPQYFDGEKQLGVAVARSFGFDRPTFDVYLFYAPGAEWSAEGLPPAELVLAQMQGVVIATAGALPAIPDQAKLMPELRGRVEVVAADQAEFPELFTRATRQFAARHPPH